MAGEASSSACSAERLAGKQMVSVCLGLLAGRMEGSKQCWLVFGLSMSYSFTFAFHVVALCPRIGSLLRPFRKAADCGV